MVEYQGKQYDNPRWFYTGMKVFGPPIIRDDKICHPAAVVVQAAGDTALVRNRNGVEQWAEKWDLLIPIANG